MNALILFLVIFALSAYASIFWHLWSHLLNKQPPRRMASLSILLIGFLLHGIALLPHLMTPLGLDLNVFNILSLTGWLMLGFTLIFSTYRPILGLNLLAIPVASLGLLAGVFLQAPYRPLRDASSGLEAHILLSLAAYCLLLMAAIQAVLLHFQNRELKHRSERRIWVALLPSLQSMETLLFDMLLVGFGLLTLALGFGQWRLMTCWRSIWYTKPCLVCCRGWCLRCSCLVIGKWVGVAYAPFALPYGVLVCC